MSYDIYFKDPVSRETIELDVPHFMRGGTFPLDGTKELYFNITFNYEPNYRKHNFNIKDLNNKTAANVIPELKRVIKLLGDQTSDNYWEPIDGNAKRALITLLTMAQMRPDAIIKVEY